MDTWSFLLPNKDSSNNVYLCISNRCFPSDRYFNLLTAWVHLSRYPAPCNFVLIFILFVYKTHVQEFTKIFIPPSSSLKNCGMFFFFSPFLPTYEFLFYLRISLRASSLRPKGKGETTRK